MIPTFRHLRQRYRGRTEEAGHQRPESPDYQESPVPSGKKGFSPSFLASNTVMIGDTFYDIDGAKENHLPSIGVTYGYGSREELEKAGADAIASSVEELQALLLQDK